MRRVLDDDVRKDNLGCADRLLAAKQEDPEQARIAACTTMIQAFGRSFAWTSTVGVDLARPQPHAL